MKKYIIKSLLLIFITVLIISCDDNESRVFDTSPSERIDASIDEYSSLLNSSENGWVLEYYPESNQQFGGFNYVIKFKENEESTVFYEGADDITVSESSTYDIIAYGGAVLTFNTYNKYMHEFANPSGALYQAKQGDYEFAFQSNENDVITLKGIKSGNTMSLLKLTETPEEYLAKVNDISYSISLASGIAINGEDSSVSLGNRHISFTTAEEEINMAYIFTTTGIKLYESITIAGNVIREFTLDKAQSQLVSLDGNVVIDLIVAPFNINQDWSIDTTLASDTSADFFSKYAGIYGANGAIYGETLERSISIGNTVNGSGLQFRSKASATTTWTAEYNLAFSPIVGKPNQLAIAKVGEGLNWSFYTHLNPLLDYVVDNAPYTAEPNTPANPTEVKLTSTVDANAWFVIKL
ncbi:DUF4302 domain-containing protein [Polaribacter butkevichii]|uniref:DUF4302 domain-containing protein n=1 Tax=Polaribacter butkevichii TaxID=218490 RepID=A0A2P6C846_9FLAO|nr:DUF4302 domain-containing protein [Polaribacter butkevichii]PQJ69109.1 hypothetical protein BTO14_13850 [Polaribacter butkevichii]